MNICEILDESIKLHNIYSTIQNFSIDADLQVHHPYTQDIKIANVNDNV